MFKVPGSGFLLLVTCFLLPLPNAYCRLETGFWFDQINLINSINLNVQGSGFWVLVAG